MVADRPVLVIADTCVLAQWVLPDEETCPGAEKLLTDVGSKQVALLAPPLLIHELANSLSMAVKRRRITASDAELAWQAFSRLGIILEEPARSDTSTLRLSFLPGVTAYDASYAALAESRGCLLYTADRRMLAALCGHSEHVRPIAEYTGVL